MGKQKVGKGKGRDFVYSINLRFGKGKPAREWIEVLKKACENLSTDEEELAVNKFLRQIIEKNPAVKKAAKELGVDLTHPPERGTYDREAAARRAKRKEKEKADSNGDVREPANA